MGITAKDLTLQKEVKTWHNKDTGEVKEFNVYHVVINGIKIDLKPVDRTAMQILDNFYKGGE